VEDESIDDEDELEDDADKAEDDDDSSRKMWRARLHDNSSEKGSRTAARRLAMLRSARPYLSLLNQILRSPQYLVISVENERKRVSVTRKI